MKVSTESEAGRNLNTVLDEACQTEPFGSAGVRVGVL
jgi:hypothetical protein